MYQGCGGIGGAPRITERTDGRLAAEVRALLNAQVRPLLKIHGGDIELVEVAEDGRVVLEFQGACRGCALKSVTYALGVRQRLLQHPDVKDVVVNGVRLSRAATDRVERVYSGYSFWAGV